MPSDLRGGLTRIDKLQAGGFAVDCAPMFGKRLYRNRFHGVGRTLASGLRSTLASAAAIGIIAGICGCGHDTRLSGKNVPSVKVGTVTMYDVVLDPNASPEQVAYVALRAMREDFFAKSVAEREAALFKQFDLCAADEIAERNRASLPRDEFIYNVVYRWTPTVSHYAADLPTDWASAGGRLVRRASKTAAGTAIATSAADDEAEVVLEVHRPGDDPASKVVLVVWLAKDNGYWRVMPPGFDRKRSVAAQAPSATRDLPPPPTVAGGEWKRSGS